MSAKISFLDPPQTVGIPKYSPGSSTYDISRIVHSSWRTEYGVFAVKKTEDFLVLILPRRTAISMKKLDNIMAVLSRGLEEDQRIINE